METQEIIILLYILFIWLVILHTFEEISQGIFNLKLKKVKLTKNKYLIGASIISFVNLITLTLIIFELRIGFYFAIFTTLVLGVFQLLVHSIGFLKEGRKARNFGAGFYSSIPLAIVATILLYYIFLEI